MCRLCSASLGQRTNEKLNLQFDEDICPSSYVITSLQRPLYSLSPTKWKENTAAIIKMLLKLTQFMRISLHVVKLRTLPQRLSEMNHSRRLKM
ncbi:hypothetical protein MHYP_G00007960 [Metynnis hypsauchen]